MEENRRALQIVSILLQYPDDAPGSPLREIERSVSTLDDAVLRKKIEQFLCFARGTPLLDLQEAYTAAFDLNPKAGLYMTYPLFEKEVERSQALVGLCRFYRSEGYEPYPGELPDFLPLILEFLSVCSPPAFDSLVGLCRTPVASLTAHLKEIEHPYAGLLEIVSKLFNEPSDGGS
jgi:nitrate reductase delta subunit